jgi:hypothetical protein
MKTRNESTQEEARIGHRRFIDGLEHNEIILPVLEIKTPQVTSETPVQWLTGVMAMDATKGFERSKSA